MRISEHPDPDAVAAAIADELLGLLRDRQRSDAVPVVVLTGGTGGARALAALGAHPRRGDVDWRRIRFLWGDERWVPAGHPERNDRLADEALFSRVETDPALVHRVAGSDAGLSLEDAARAYAELVAGIDRIDVALNGVGEDGHVASLFPGRPELLAGETAPAALAIRESPKPPPERVTLALRSLNRAERVWLVATGAGKAAAVARLRADAAGGAGPDALPAARVAGTRETVLWADAAALSGMH
ncbi:6-phosphogluconolactonase [Leucobacter allii]|uniref:6-phosphogluconolactonase n=1 Tax=Leucobacter allii TaxID=2932247 RepID=A0ABY4FQB9_9MICO|nr:6-phosphogluconolactonase [Leucobacter allii]UOQ58488.1 6-phosphogluconolactonase [Leucobacter allii]